MTLDDLVKIFDDAHWSAHSRRAGIAAVVRALRDKFHSSYANAWLGLTVDDLDSDFNEILGSDAGEKAAGEISVATDAVGGSSATLAPTSSAADPKVCVWRGSVGHAVMGCTGYFATGRYLHCPGCNLPVKFQE